MKRILLPLLMALGFSSGALAVPSLQLGIIGGTYDTATETVVASGPTFSLFAALKPTTGNPLTDVYGLSMAVVPKTSVAASLGSFTIASSTANIASRTVNVTGDMVYGVPPLEQIATQLFDPGDLGQHGIFETFFAEQTFSFGGQQSALFNTVDGQDNSVPNSTENVGKGPSAFPGTGMYYEIFTIDVTNLDAGAAIHFDLYNMTLIEKCKKTGNNCLVGDIDVSAFAPFSHDAQSGKGGGGGGGGGNLLPEPGSLALLGLALAGLGAMRRRFF